MWTQTDGNGEVVNIDYENRLVLVFFHHKKISKTIEMDEFFGCLDEKLNQWVLADC